MADPSKIPFVITLAAHPNIDFIVLTKGVPIRITGAAMGSCDEHSRDSVELCAGIRRWIATWRRWIIPTCRAR